MKTINDFVLITLACLAFLLLTEPVRSAEITKVNDTIYIDGNIKIGDFKKFAKLSRYGDKVNLKSGGGYLKEAIKMGYLVRSLEMGTIIAKGNDCASACGLIFLSGKTRQFDGRLGIHCSYLKGTKECYKPGIDQMKAFLLEVSTQKIADFYFENAQQMKMKWFIDKN